MQRIPFSQPSFDEEETRAIERVLSSRWIVEGPERDAFEKEFAQFIGAPEIIAVSGATEALFLLLKAHGIAPGDEVIVPSLTFVATAHVVLHTGATPVFADVTPYPHLCLDPKDVAAKRTSKTKVVIPVHYAGNLAFRDYDDLLVIEDSAHRIESNDMGKNPMAFSFHATKNVTSGRGGAIAVHDTEKASWLRKARNFGITKDSVERYQQGSWRYSVDFAGWSFHLTDIAASLGRVQLKKLPNFLSKRKEFVDLYNNLLGLNNTGLHLYPILVNDRAAFINWMHEHHVQCSVHFQPLHLMPLYKNSVKLPVTESVGEKLVSLPLYPKLSHDEVDYIANLIKAWQKKHGKP